MSDTGKLAIQLARFIDLSKASGPVATCAVITLMKRLLDSACNNADADTLQVFHDELAGMSKGLTTAILKADKTARETN